MGRAWLSPHSAPSTPPPSAGIHSRPLQGHAMQSWWLLQNRKAAIQTRPFSCQKCGVFAVCPRPANQTLALCPRPRTLPGTLWVKHPIPPLWPRGLRWHLPLQGWPPQAPPGAALSRRPHVVLECRVDRRTETSPGGDAVQAPGRRPSPSTHSPHAAPGPQAAHLGTRNPESLAGPWAPACPLCTSKLWAATPSALTGGLTARPSLFLLPLQGAGLAGLVDINLGSAGCLVSPWVLCGLGLPWGWLVLGAGVPAFLSGVPCVLPAGPQGGGAGRAPCLPGPQLLRGGCISGGRGAAVGLSGPALPGSPAPAGGPRCCVKTEAQLSPRPPRTPDPRAPSLVCPSPQHSGDQEPGSPTTQTSSRAGRGKAKPRVLNAEGGGCHRWPLEMCSFVHSCPRRRPPGLPQGIRQELRDLTRPRCCWAVVSEAVFLV